jgi:hypothetical protein
MNPLEETQERAGLVAPCSAIHAECACDLSFIEDDGGSDVETTSRAPRTGCTAENPRIYRPHKTDISSNLRRGSRFGSFPRISSR